MTDALHTDMPAVARRRELRRFGLTMGAAFLVLGAFLLWRHRISWPYVGALGGLFLLCGLLWPGALGPVQWLWMKVARAMGWFMTRVILTVIFIVIFSPAGLIMRLLRRDPLRLRLRPDAPSYWHGRESDDRSPERMERMF